MLKESIPKSKVNIIYDGVDLEKHQNIDTGILRKEFNLDSAPIVGMAGRIIEGKGHKEFILAAKKIIEINFKVKFVVIGDAKGGEQAYFNEVRNLVKIEGLKENFIFTGWRNDVLEIMAGFDLIVQPYTLPEGLPNVLIEAMSLGKPIITTNIPGPSEIIINGENGFLVPPGNPEALANGILRLLDNPALAKQMGDAGKKRAEKLFDIKKNVKQIERIYEEFLS